MPGYPTSVSRKVRSYSQGARTAKGPFPRPSRPFRRFTPPRINSPAGRFARTLPVTARGLGFVLPALQGFFIGLAIGGYIADQLFPSTQSQNISFGDPVPPNYSPDPVNPDPWTAFPGNTLGTPMGRANTGYNFIMLGPPPYLGNDLPFVNPGQYATWEQLHFNGTPFDSWWATSSWSRTGDLIAPVPMGGYPAIANLQHVIPEWAPAFPQSAPGADIADNMRSSPFEQGYKIGSVSPEARDVWAVNFSPSPSFRTLPEEEVFDIFKWLEGGGNGPPPGARKVPGPTWDFDPKRREIEGIPNHPTITVPDGYWDFMDRPWPRDWVWAKPPPAGWYKFFDDWYYWDGTDMYKSPHRFGVPPEVFYGPGVRRGHTETGGEDFLYDYDYTPNVRFDTGAKPAEGGSISRTPYRNQGYKIPDAKIKTNMDPRWVATRLYNAFTEFGDFTDAVYKALPQKVKLPVWDARLKKWRPPTGVEKWERLSANWDRLDWEKVLVNVYEDQIEDFYYGQIGRQAGKAQQAVFKNFGFGDGPTYLTRTMKLGVGRLPNFSLPQLSGNIRPSKAFIDGLY